MILSYREMRSRIVLRYGTQRMAARALEIRECDLSTLINAHRAPRPREFEKITKALGIEFAISLRLRAEKDGQLKVA